MHGILFLVEYGNVHVICNASNREDAKRTAWKWIGYDRDRYMVTPLTDEGDRIKIDIALSV
jgi:hypothetical protein